MKTIKLTFAKSIIAGLIAISSTGFAFSESVNTSLSARYPAGSEVSLIGGFTLDTPKEPGQKLYSSVRFEGDWLVSCEVSSGRMVQYANFIDGARMDIKGKVARHTTFGMELEKGCELQLSESQ